MSKALATARFRRAFLPAPLGETELAAMIAEAIAKSGAAGPADMGKVMKELKDKTSGRVDGKVLSDKVRLALQSR